MRVVLTTSLNDQLVGPLRRSVDEVEKSVQQLERATSRLRDGKGRFIKTTNETSREIDEAARQTDKLSRNTQNALTLAERLKNVWTQTGNVMRGAMTGFAAYQAAKYVMAPALQDGRTYDRQLRDLGNTAFGELSGSAFTAKINTLDALLKMALREGGGTREGAVGAAGTLMAQGGLTELQLEKVMPTIMKAATAANAQPNDIANVVAAAVKNGHSVDAINSMIGKAIASGQAGGFEMKDMAKWLPKLLAAGSAIGMTGSRDYEEILALAQVSRTTAGGSDEAGNNLLNFLLKVNAPDTQNDAKKQDVDLSGTLAKNRDKGVSAAMSFLDILRREMDKDPRIVKLRAQYTAAATDGQRVASLTAQEQIFGGSAMGKYLQDRQALMPAIAALNNPAELQRQLKAVQQGGAHTLTRAFGNIADGTDFKHQQAENEKLFALNNGLNPVNQALSKLDEQTTNLYRQYPGYATAVETAKWAVGGLAAAAAAAGAAQWLLARQAGGAGAAAAAPALAPAAAAGGIGMGTVVGGMLTGGAAATLFAGSVVASNSEAFANMGADAGDTAFAAAIMNASKEGQAGRDAEAAERAEFIKGFASRPVKLYIDGREIAAEVEKYMGLDAQRR
jgi:hypothetical protein